MRWSLLELAGVAGTAAAFVALPKPPDAVRPLAVFIPCCVLGWLAYGAVRLRADPTLRDRWGLRPSAHLRPILVRLVPLGAALVPLGATWAALHGRPLLPEALLLSLALYPLWGLVQQWLVQALLVDNVRQLTGATLPWLVALGAVGFGAVHLQHPVLVVATAVMGGVYVALFQRWRNLWPLAVAHGWLGSLFYPWVLGLDPLADLLRAIGLR
ncbi:MAG: CPBP family glutamic-type intramembrane protease [Myxococcota bacterium]